MKAVEAGTSISMMAWDPELDGDVIRKPAYKEGHFIPGRVQTINY